MLVKAKLASRIAEIIRERRWTQQQGSEVLGIPQSRLPQILRGQLQGISETKLIDCLLKLGRDIQFVLGKPRRTSKLAGLQVVFQS